MQKAIIIGATSGIGQEVARILVQQGWHIGIAGRRKEALHALQTTAPDRIVTEQLDVTEETATLHLHNLIEKLGGMDLFFLSSGVGHQNRDLQPDIELNTARTNVEGFTRMVTAAFNYFKEKGSGHIAVISSIAGTKGLGVAPAYSATKRFQNIYIEGLFLSSGVVRNPDYTMERLVRVAKDLRTIHRFNGYIHLKSIPGASRELVNEAGLYADRLSVNVEIPKEENLKLLAPEKDHKSVYAPMRYIQQGVLESSEERKKHRHAPRFAPAGQSTQMIVGATAETDKDILYLSSALYKGPTMRRVYYSGYISVNTYDKRLPALKQPPLVRENRLYQADWLMRFYQFKVEEIVDDAYPDLDLEIDPKLSWALRHPEQFPVDVNKADYELLLRVPGIGVKSARLIVASRRFSKIGFYQLKKIGVVMKKAQYFITCCELPMHTVNELTPQGVRSLLLPKPNKKKVDERQLMLDFGE